jgi:hypothetical protein
VSSLPDNVEKLIARALDSPVQLDALLVILLEPGRAWTASTLASALRIGEAQAARRLDELCARSFLDLTVADTLIYRYAPANSDLAESAAALQRTCITQRDVVLDRILALGNDHVRLFSEAFRLGKKKP